MAKTDGAGFASLSWNSFILLFPFLLESCSYVNGVDNFRVVKRQADLSRSRSGHLIGDYRNHFLFSFLVRNQLRNAVGRGGISSLFPRSARISASCPHLWILKFENKIYNSAPPYKSNSTFFLYKKKFANPKLKRETAVT